MQEIRISDIDELLHSMNSFESHYVFRGQANAEWGLTSALERIVGSHWNEDNAAKFEDYALAQFRSKFHLYDRENERPSSKLGWLAIMQHYGVPTRLIDLTESPYVALYFALENYSVQYPTDFSVFAIDYRKAMKVSLAEVKNRDKQFDETVNSLFEKSDEVFDKIVDRFGYDIIWITEPGQMNARLDRQAGSFLLSVNRGARVEPLLGSPIYAGAGVYKLRIDRKLYPNVIALLKKMNLTSKSLYGDLDGLARSVRMELQVRAYQLAAESALPPDV